VEAQKREKEATLRDLSGKKKLGKEKKKAL